MHILVVAASRSNHHDRSLRLRRHPHAARQGQEGRPPARGQARRYANIGSIFGIGYPAWTGGALQFIYGVGIDAFSARASQLAGQYGPGFALTAQVLDSLRAHQPVY